MNRVIRWALAAALLPICIGASSAAFDLVKSSAPALEFWVPFGGGVVAWILVFLTLPKPLWLYVVGHELTHALWGLVFGARVKSVRATSKGGQVVLSRSNTLIALAPYFFPFYTALFTLLALGIRWFWPHPWIDPLFHFGLGVTYAFHATLTGWILRIRQTDITGEGYLLSAMIIWLGNLITVILAIPLLTGSASPWAPLQAVFFNTGHCLDFTLHAGASLLRRIAGTHVAW